MKVFLIGLILCCLPAQVPHALSWQELADVTFITTPDGGLKPDFAATVQALDSVTVEIEGYMLPLTVDNQLFILSRYPFSECFFCGGAGKESVIELKPEKAFKFDVDDPVKVRGRLRLETDPMQLAYILEDAILVP